MKTRTIIATVLAAMAVAGCNHDRKGGNDNPTEDKVVYEAFSDTIELEFAEDEDNSPAPAKQEGYFARKSRQNATTRYTPSSGTTAAKPNKKAESETIYVETDGAQGRVWGHVTMKGDRGTGTIHDWDENTLTVTVTRHGDELFALDQNSRQYIFKLKK